MAKNDLQSILMRNYSHDMADYFTNKSFILVDINSRGYPDQQSVGA